MVRASGKISDPYTAYSKEDIIAEEDAKNFLTSKITGNSNLIIDAIEQNCADKDVQAF